MSNEKDYFIEFARQLGELNGNINAVLVRLEKGDEKLAEHEDFLMAQELREDDEAFARGRARAVEEFGEEAVEAVLEEASHG